ncbi:MAG: V-type ATP synthase subunit E [Treponema sp.]|jgi:V/A-type H+-transporting ATPase subunit E|nr:V-type ATP synthase subunit E [Treponema sp.]
MEIQLQELIDKIKKDGIESASGEAARIKRDAEAEAARIVSQAQKEAVDIVNRGKADAERSEKAGVAAVEQASRNLVLAFKGEIQGLLDKLVAEAVSGSYSADVVKGILPELVKNWAVMNTDSLSVLLSEGDLNKLDSGFKANLASALKGGVELKVGKSLDAGFRIMEKDGSAFYDFSAEAVAKMLSAYLNPKLAETLNNAAKGSVQ